MKDLTGVFEYMERAAFAAHKSHTGEFFAFNIHGFLQIDTDSPVDPDAQATYDYFQESDATIDRVTGETILSEWAILHYEQIDGKARAGEIVHQTFEALADMGAAWHHVLVHGTLPQDEL